MSELEHLRIAISKFLIVFIGNITQSCNLGSIQLCCLISIPISSTLKQIQEILQIVVVLLTHIIT